MDHNSLKKNIVRLKGDKIDLCIQRRDDEAIEKYITWMNDEEILQWIGRNTSECHLQDELEWINRTLKNEDHPFNIVEKSTGELIGNCDITVEKHSRNAVLGICIGEPSARNKGYGTEVIKMLIKYGFEEIGLHNITLELNGDNHRAHRCYEKAGFKDCCREKESVWYNGHWADTITMQILEHEYREFKEKETNNEQ